MPSQIAPMIQGKNGFDEMLTIEKGDDYAGPLRDHHARKGSMLLDLELKNRGSCNIVQRQV